MFALFQAASACVVAWYTVILVDATIRYAYAADAQVNEARIARLAGLQPHIHVAHAAIDPWSEDEIRQMRATQPASGQGPNLRVSLVNMGPGPALSLRAYVTHKFIGFTGPMLDPMNLRPYEQIDNVVLAAVTRLGRPPVGQNMPNKVGLRVEYRDIFGRYWKTALQLGIEIVSSTTGDCSCSGIVALDQTERVDQIDEPYIRQDTLAPLHLIDEDLDVGTTSRPVVAAS